MAAPHRVADHDHAPTSSSPLLNGICSAPVGLPADRSFVKHNFVPAPPPHAEIATKPQVAYVGRLDEAKGAPFLMRAWDAFRARHPQSPLRLVVVGGGDMSAAVARWATDTPP